MIKQKQVDSKVIGQGGCPKIIAIFNAKLSYSSLWGWFRHVGRISGGEVGILDIR